jgi:uncharacterized integral membrane protein
MSDRPQGSRSSGADQGLDWHRWLLIVSGALLILFCLLNSQKVTVHLLIATVEMPLIVALVIAALLGALVGWAVPRLRRPRQQ